MASSGKKKTTMAKLDRERRMREKRMDKAARKEARKAEAANPTVVQDDETFGDEMADATLEPVGAAAAER